MIVSSFHCDQCGAVKTNLLGFAVPDNWIEVTASGLDPRYFCCNMCFKKAIGGG